MTRTSGGVTRTSCSIVAAIGYVAAPYVARVVPIPRRGYGAALLGAALIATLMFAGLRSAEVRALVAAHIDGQNQSERLWSLVNLEIWHRVVVEGEPATSLQLL